MEKDKIFVTLHATFKDEEKCRVAMERIVTDAHAAYGVNSHFWFRSTDGTSLFVLEQYQDNKAVSQAIRRFTTARISFFRSIEEISISIYGNMSKGNRLLFTFLRPQYMNYYGGYSKDVATVTEAGIKDDERNRILVSLNAVIQDEEKCKASMDGVLSDAYARPGTKTHFWCRNDDNTSLFVLEQYANEQALLEHLAANPPARATFFKSITPTDVTMYGDISDTTKEMFAALDPKYMNYYGGYSK